MQDLTIEPLSEYPTVVFRAKVR